MKFAEHLAAHITPEWRKQYISYEEMKAMLYAAVEQAPSAEVTEQEIINRYYARFDEQFFRVCDKELAKINTFFSEKMAEATRKFNTLNSELQASKEQHGDGLRRKKAFDFIPRINVPARKMQDLKLAFSEFYLSLILLQNYQNLNFTGFRKILKKHDKLLTTDLGSTWREENVDSSNFVTNKDIDKLIGEVEGTFTSELESGDRGKAMKRLRVPPLGEAQSPWTTFKVGLFSGAFIVLLVAVLLSGILDSSQPNVWVAVRLFRGPLLVIIFLFLIGINIYGWRSSGVNHVLIFEIDPRNHLTEQHLIEIAAIFGVIWALSLLGFLYADNLSIPPYSVPLSMVSFMMIFLFNPSRTFHHEARFWLIKKLGRVVVAPFAFVQFADFWLGDQLNTLVFALKDFEYTFCFYTFDNIDWRNAASGDSAQCTDPTRILASVVSCLPAWFRFAQCLRRYKDTREIFPHLANAFKYATTFFVVIFAHLTHNYANQYPSKTANPWTVQMILTELNLATGNSITTVLAPLEVFRRFVWNFFRLENEHINNCGKFRAVRDISVIPIDASDQAQIVKMMDEEDGVVNRKKKKAGGGKMPIPAMSFPMLSEKTGVETSPQHQR
ncbi:SPX domain [Trinorchestia longiramus]|nr:SPX domain [Trinorchestia longiramus]